MMTLSKSICITNSYNALTYIISLIVDVPTLYNNSLKLKTDLKITSLKELKIVHQIYCV